MSRITVAQLAEQVADLAEAVQALTQHVTSPAPAPAPSEPEAEVVVEHPAEGELRPRAASQQVEQVEISDLVGFSAKLARQAEKSAGGKLRFWGQSNDDDDALHASVYIGGADGLKAKALTITLVADEHAQARLKVLRTKAGRRRSTKGRQAWEGKFAYGDATVDVFVNIPAKLGKSLPDEVGFKLDGLS